MDIFKGKVAVVTAGGSGMGREIARRLSDDGAHVFIADINEQALEETARELSSNAGKVEPIRCDVGSDADMAALADRVLSSSNGVDYLFNHAGTVLAGVIEKIGIPDWQAFLNINLLGTVRGLNAFLPSMIARRQGHIVNTASSLGLFPDIGVVMPYITSKAGLVGLTRSLHHYVDPFGIKVTLFCPDITFTNFHWSGKWIGLSKEEVDANLPLDKQQPVEGTIQHLLDCMTDGRFLASTTPNYHAMLVKAAENDLDPSRARIHEI